MIRPDAEMLKDMRRPDASSELNVELMLRPELTSLKEVYDPTFESMFSIVDIETLVTYFTSTYFSKDRMEM